MRIDIERLCFGYGRGSEILHDVSLSLEGPGLVCIVGPNGVGKSTLIKCINGVLTPTSGRVSIDGTDVRDLGRKELALKVGYVPPKTEELFAMPVMDTVMMFMTPMPPTRSAIAPISVMVMTCCFMLASASSIHCLLFET